MYLPSFFKTSSRRLALLAVVMSLTGCSTVSDTVSSVTSGSVSVLSNLNPFGADKPATEKASTQEQVAPEQVKPATLLVEAAPAEPVKLAQAAPQPNVETTIGDNKQCTTFCALPVRKPR